MEDIVAFISGNESVDPIDMKFKKGDKDKLVEKIQFAINGIYKLKGISEITVDKKNYKLPISISSELDDSTYIIATEVFPSLKNKGFISVREARRSWVYTAGNMAKAFPSNLVSTSNYKELQKVYGRGFVDKSKKESDRMIEDILRAYEILGAKSIKIVDNTDVNLKNEVSVAGEGNFSNHANFTKEVLREKTFGKHTFDNALTEDFLNKFQKLPKVLGTIKSRLNGNLLSEIFFENIALGAGIEGNVLNQLSVSAGFNINRKWEISVEFYDKTEL
jgi:hypothetical protein